MALNPARGWINQLRLHGSKKTRYALEVLEGGTDYLTFETVLKSELDGLGCGILEALLEALEQKIYESKERKSNWNSKRKDDHKGILTSFGMVRYKRRYYYNKESGEYKYLLDERISVTAHKRVGVNCSC